VDICTLINTTVPAK